MRKVWIALIIVSVLVIGFIIFTTQTNNTNKQNLNTNTQNPETTNQTNTQINQRNTNSQKTYTVDIKNFAFIPSELKIKKGESVTWINKDLTRHTVTSDSGSELDSELLSNEQSYSHIFNNQGTFEYYCKPHPYMKGKVIVE